MDEINLIIETVETLREKEDRLIDELLEGSRIKDKVLAVLAQTSRRIRFMKKDEFEHDIEDDNQIKFCTYWTKDKVTITIDFEDII